MAALLSQAPATSEAAKAVRERMAAVEQQAPLEEDRADILRVHGEWHLQCLRTSLDALAMRALLGDELVEQLKVRGDSLEKELVHHRQLQISAVSDDVDFVTGVLSEVENVGLATPGAWFLEDGPRLLARVAHLKTQLKEQRDARVSMITETQKRIQELSTSFDVHAMQQTIIRAVAYDIEADSLAALRERCATLEIQQPLCLQLQQCTACPDLQQVTQTVAQARDSGLDDPAKWLVPQGPSMLAAAEAHLQRIEAIKVRIATATSEYDIKELAAAFRESEDLGIPMSEYQDALLLFERLQNDAYVEKMVCELCDQGPGDVSKVHNLLAVIEDPDLFDTCEALGQQRFREALKCVKVRETGFLCRPTCTEFVKRYAILAPIKERKAAVDGTDFVKIARTLIDMIARACPQVRLKPPDIVVGQKKVFMKSGSYKALEEELRKVTSKSIVKLQAHWRGHRERATKQPAIKEAVEISNAISTSLAEGAESMAGDVPEHMEESLRSLDDLLLRAAKTKLLLPRLHQCVQARSALAAKAKLAREIESHMESVDVTAMSALIARSEAQGIKGSKIAALLARRDALRAQLALRRALQVAAAQSDIVAVEKTVSGAKLLGLDEPGKWLFADGPDLLAKATTRLSDLEREKEASGSVNLEKGLQDMLSSTDAQMMRAFLLQAEAVGFCGDNVEALRNRCAVMQEQHKMLRSLRGCIALSEPDAVATVVSQVKAAGLTSQEAWLVPEGPTYLDMVERWAKRLEEKQRAEASAAVDLEGQMEDLLLSLDGSAMKALLANCEECGARAELAHQLCGRLEALQSQAPVCDNLRRCGMAAEELQAAVEAAHAAGLSEGEAWLFPHGPRFLARALERQNLLQKAKSAPESSDADFDEGKQQAVKVLRKCLVADSIEEVRMAVASARGAGLDKPSAWPTPDGHSIYLLAISRLEQLEDELGSVALANIDLEWQLGNLRALFTSAPLPLLLGRQLSQKILERCETANAQLPYRQALQVCGTYDSMEELETASAKVRDAGLDSASRWLLPEGPKLYTMTTTRLGQLREEAKAAEGAVEQIEQELKELRDSLDLPAMQATLARASTCAVKQDLVHEVKQRVETLQKQLELRTRLQACGVSEEYKDVDAIILAVQEGGLTSPESWLLPDGPKLYARAMARQEQLQEVEAVKARISIAASRLDAKDLQAAMHKANELGLPQAKYTEAHAIYLNLHNEDWVASKIATLRKSCQTDPMYAVMVANLTEQMEALGVKVDSVGMQDVTKDMVAKRKSRRTSLHDSLNVATRQAAQLCFEDLSNFSRLRDPLTWGARGLVGVDGGMIESPLEHQKAMLEFTDDHIQMSLTQLPTELEHQAIANFTEVQRCMGDKPQTSAWAGDKEDPIVETALKGTELCDEVYVQVMKQLSNNPSSLSATSGWELLAVLCRKVLPSEDLCEFVRAFLERAAKQDVVPSNEDQKEESENRLRKARKSIRAETESRTRDRSKTWTSFVCTMQPQLAAEALENFLATVKETR